MKKYFLVCNSHIDPVWMWDWSEGAATAISTFYQAAELLEESDFVFCHNEALLYEYIEEYEPSLFDKIRKLVKRGKWKIMGGWYLQPDCNLPSGESLLRQIELGRKYFAEKFGVRPTVAVNFDSFGHSVGLVQILKKTGYDGYLCCRPMSWGKAMVSLPDVIFKWVGKDGSEVKVARCDDISLYCTGFGIAKSEIERKTKLFDGKDSGIVLWGVGNHGGNPSRKDIKDVNEMIKEGRIGEEEAEIKHSYPEEFFVQMSPYKSFNGSFQPCLIGCYASMNDVKKKHIELETALYETEKICTLAKLNGYAEYNEAAFTEAEKALLKTEFHDLLAGTVCPDAEKTSLELIDYALTLLKREYDKAFFAYARRSGKAAEGEFPIFVFNSSPYDRNAVFETEYLMPDAIASDEKGYEVTVKQDGKIVRSQVIKEKININYDRRKRVAIAGLLKAGEINRFDISVKVTPKKPKVVPLGDTVVSDGVKSVKISEKTGLVESFAVFGREILSGGAFKPVAFDDYPDPWGWGMKKIGTSPEDFGLSPCDKGVFKGLKSVRVVEDGEVLTEVESLYEKDGNFVRVDHKIYKETQYADVSVNVLWNENAKALKLRVPFALKGKFIGQIPYASDEFAKNGEEIVAHRFVAVTDGEYAAYIANDCVYSFSMDNDDLYITLLRGIAYCAHPIENRPLLEQDRFIPFVETGRHTFDFRIGYCKLSELENATQEFVARKEGLNYFPHGEYAQPKKFEISDKSVSLSSCRFVGEEYELRLFNNNADERSAIISVDGIKSEYKFGSCEVKTLVFDGEKFREKELWV